MTDSGLRERKKERTRDELVEAALALFAERGYDGTTVEAIAAAVNVSPRTFFRYFPVKEDVLFGDAGEGARRAELLVTALRDDPRDESPAAILRDALLALVATYEDDLATLLLRKRVIAATPTLRTRAVERRSTWEAFVVEELQRRYGTDPTTTLRLRVTVAATTAALDVALDTWLESGGRFDLGRVIDEAFDHLAGGPADRPRR